MDSIKLIGTDLDGTLLRDDKTLSQKTLAALDAAHRKGIHIVPITGRPLKGVPDCVRKLESIEYIISSNGANIYDVAGGKTLLSLAIDSAKSRVLIDELRRLDCMFEPFADGAGYTEKHIFDYYVKTFKGTPLEDYFFSSRVVCEKYEDLFDGKSLEAEEFFINCADADIRGKVIELTEKIGGLQYCNLGDRFIEITKLGTDKGAALRAICSHLGVDINDTIAFGDGENDLQFMQSAGTAVAVENAFPIIKQNADIIAKSNNDDGVAEIIFKITSNKF